MNTTYSSIIKHLKSLADPETVKGMARFGINSNNTLGISMPILRKLGKEIGKNHELALQLWNSQIHEAQILASLIDETDKVTEKQMDAWISDFDSWDVCDQACLNLFWKTPYAYYKAKEWCSREKEFEKRAGFALIAVLGLKDKPAKNKNFEELLPFIVAASDDNRNFVRKAVNWALRQIGKRNLILNKITIQTAKEIQKQNRKSARWIAADAIRELTSNKIQKRLTKKESAL